MLSLKFNISSFIGLTILILTGSECIGQIHERVEIKGGEYVPLYGKGTAPVVVDDFYMDVYPVTNEQFLEFVKANENWQRSKVLKLFAEENYLSDWAGDTVLGKKIVPKSPVVNVSWFAAKKYCESLDARLPTVDEWEYVAMADQTRQDARTVESYNQYILEWYETPKTYNNKIGNTFKNYWGVYDLHGLVWEWTLDFNSVLISGESRKDVDNDSNLFCGSAAIGATDLMNYAAFMRYAFRGSVKANYGVRNLGFRCVKDK